MLLNYNKSCELNSEYSDFNSFRAINSKECHPEAKIQTSILNLFSLMLRSLISHIANCK